MEISTRRLRLLMASLALAVAAVVAFHSGVLRTAAAAEVVRSEIAGGPASGGQRDPAPGRRPSNVDAGETAQGSRLDSAAAPEVAPSLIIGKSDGVTEVVPGDTLTYTIAVTYAGGPEISQVVVTDTLPPVAAFQGGSPGWRQVGATNAYTFDLGSLTDGATRTLTLTARLADVGPLYPDAITNNVTVADGGGGQPHPASTTDVDAVAIPEDLVVGKTDAVTEVMPGQILTYTIIVANTGDQGATGVVVTDTLPMAALFQGGSPGWGPVAGSMGAYTYAIGSLAVEEARVLSLTLAVTNPVPAGLQAITNTVEVADDRPAYAWSTDVDAVLAAPSMAIEKTDGLTTVRPGDPITYAITISNTGNQDAAGVVVTETLPALTTFEAGTSGWQEVSGSPGTYTYALGGLSGAAQRLLTLTVRLTATVPVGLHQITNTVEVADDSAAHASAADVDDVEAAPDLTLRKTDGLTTVVPGQAVAYTIAITNAGDRETTGVVVTDALPALTTFDAGTPGWQAVAGSMGTYTYAVGSLPGASARVLTLTVSLTDAVPAGVDAITNAVALVDDTAFTTRNVDADQLAAAPDLAIAKTDGVTSVVPGGTVTYTITISNAGNQDATGVLVTDTLPSAAHTELVTATGDAVQAGLLLTWPPFDLAAGDQVSQTVVVGVKSLTPWPAGVEVITNTAEVADDGTNEFVETVQTVDVDAVDASPDLLVSKTDNLVVADPEQDLIYELSYLNEGTQVATGVVLTETVPTHTSFNVAASTPGWVQVGGSDVYTFSLGTVSPTVGGAVDFAVTVSDTIPAGVAVIDNVARIGDDGSSGPDLNPEDNQDYDQDLLSAAPDLQVAKDDGVASLTPGQTITYALTVANVGAQGATGVVITDTLPAAVVFITASHEPTLSGPLVTWSLGELAAGEQVTRTLTVQVLLTIPPGVDVITNTVHAADDGTNGADANPGDNMAVDADTVEARPRLALFKDDGRTAVKPGDVLTYTIRAKNVGDQAAGALVITDTLPAHTTFVGASPGYVAVNGTIVWTGIGLPVGAQVERTLTVQVNASVPPGVITITNRAEVAGPEGVYDADTDVDVVLEVPDLVVTKENGEEAVAPGTVVTYTLTISNGGTGAATGVVITDTLPEPTTFAAASDGGAETSPSSRVVTWPLFDLAAGGAVTRSVSVEVADAIPAGMETITNTVEVADDGTHGPDLDPDSNRAQDADTLDAEPLLTLAKDDGQEIAVVGDILTYTLTITNAGDQGATGVLMTDTLPSHSAFVAASPGYTYEPTAGTVTWPAVALAADEVVSRSVTVQLAAALPSGLTTVTNTVVATGDGGLSASAEDVDRVVSAPDLRLIKTDGRRGTRPGEVLTYTLVVKNVGTQGATGVVLTDTLPAQTSLIAASHGGDETSPSSGVVVWPEVALAAGAAMTRTLTVEVPEMWPAEAPPLLTNTAFAADDGANGDDLEPLDNTDVDLTYIWRYQIYLPVIAKH